jgi:histone acetyltransferase (RNA polymerase elongator complex component)
MNKRGHTRSDVFEGARKIKSAGIELGLQMMPGLYGDTRATILKTAEDIVAIAPKTVRIYPTVVVKNTELEKLYENGEFTPLSLDEAVEICSELLLKFEEKGIHVIKMGLHSETSLELDVVAGPYHPSFKELCLSEIYLKRILEKIGDEKEGRIYVCPRELSQAKGQKGTNLKRLSEKGKNIEILPDEALSAGEIIFEKGRNVK